MRSSEMPKEEHADPLWHVSNFVAPHRAFSWILTTTTNYDHVSASSQWEEGWWKGWRSTSRKQQDICQPTSAVVHHTEEPTHVLATSRVRSIRHQPDAYRKPALRRRLGPGDTICVGCQPQGRNDPMAARFLREGRPVQERAFVVFATGECTESCGKL